MDGDIPWLVKPSSLTMINIDYDYDGIFAPFDNCPNGLSVIGYDFDLDKDGCHDILEDLDDDGDGVDDLIDSCNFGLTNWIPISIQIGTLMVVEIMLHTLFSKKQ